MRIYDHYSTSLWPLQEGSCRKVFKPWSERTNFENGGMRSNDDDPEMLLYIPFTGSVTLKAFCVIGAPDGASPGKVRAYINNDNLDFDAVTDIPPVQEWYLQEDFRCENAYRRKHICIPVEYAISFAHMNQLDVEKMLRPKGEFLVYSKACRSMNEEMCVAAEVS